MANQRLLCSISSGKSGCSVHIFYRLFPDCCKVAVAEISAGLISCIVEGSAVSFGAGRETMRQQDNRSWWTELPVGTLEKVRVESDLATLSFAESQIQSLEKRMAEWAAKETQVTRLMQITGIGLVTAVTPMAAIGDIRRFPSANQLVGYSGLGARVHDSGLTIRTGGITKASADWLTCNTGIGDYSYSLSSYYGYVPKPDQFLEN